MAEVRDKQQMGAALRGDAMVMTLLVLLMLLGCQREEPAPPPMASPATSKEAYAGTIAAVGDSLTAGLGVAENRSYPALLEEKLKAHGYRFKVVNAGVSGETSSGTLSRIDWVISSLNPDMVILETGANDGLRGIPLEVLEKNLDSLVIRLQQANIVVILAGMQMLPNLGPEYTAGFASLYPAMAKKHGVLLIPFFLEGVAGSAHLNQADKIHPTAEGYARIVENVYPPVVAAIKIHRQRAAAASSQKQRP